MTEKQKQIIMKLAGDPELLKEFLDMTNAMGEKPVANEATVSLYVMRRHTEDGTEYYHPVVAPTNPFDPAPETYIMIADPDIVKLQKMYGAQVRMMAAAVREEPIVITIPEKTYNELKEKLSTLVTAIYAKIDEAHEILEGLTALTRRPLPALLKGQMTAAIMSEMRISGQCLNKDYEIEDAHEYVEDVEPDEDCCCGECDGECSCGMWDEDECETCECPKGGHCCECDECSDYGDCPCTC